MKVQAPRLRAKETETLVLNLLPFFESRKIISNLYASKTYQKTCQLKLNLDLCIFNMLNNIGIYSRLIFLTIIVRFVTKNVESPHVIPIVLPV